ncbi:hypothetical protein H5392_01320 [Tessaracoccus sp. MC1865]|uniref:hypothetical protein n=1 Tax=Tessaracoccus sp. MC1865 TaxID=2760310 RepID=UPI00160496B4|nr:hypothetical protein [Tessaracoccus sp. MC1865]MBB1482497.1 hypothetical protein [Tessaracoccus sp. MC1865]QTO38048.1 hypothetical protein J7D54_02770 [Tessaracoccus sp. MC1865]
MDATSLAAYVNSSPDDSFVVECWNQATALVDAYIGTAEVPHDAVSRATLEVAAELFHRRQAPGGITQFATIDGPSPVRLARDPMLGAYPILDRFLPGGFA